MTQPLIITLPGAADWDGLTRSTGLIILQGPDLESGNELPSRAIIHSLSLFGAAGTITTADIFVGRLPPFPVGTFPLQHPKKWVGTPIAPTFAQDIYFGCGIVVPPGFVASFMTTGKTDTSTLIVDWSPVPPGSGCIDSMGGLTNGGGPPA